ncbi:hypothetical protein [Marinobacter sp. AN1]|uniref:hypothetical protein n=1 Tax=Marinobacter sp. AN1 TaxID=2886046 RepID=UPI0022325B5A|nr:hypothetical protein [Marinobacter sp. AN1]UZD67070.1 hypothetical protein LJ360_07065 [Marinobacter sp. AN1]
MAENRFFVTLIQGLLLCLALATPAFAATPSQAFINAGEQGQAVLMGRLGECYAVTPAHVVGDSLFSTLVGTGNGRPRGDGDLLQVFGYDLAILRVTGGITSGCGTAIDQVVSLDSHLASAGSGQVVSVNPDGSVSRRHVLISDVGILYIRVSPVGEQDQLFKGLSGSLVTLGSQPVGLLMSVDPDTGEGRALRFDRALETLRPFFGLASAKREPASEQPPEAGPARSGNLVTEVLSWSSAPLDADHRATNLLRSGKAPWLARAGEFPLEVIVDLAGDRAVAIDRVELVGEGVAPPERLPRDFEVLIRTTGEGGWMPVYTGTYFQNEPARTVRFAPVRARQVMLRIHSHWGDPSSVGLAELRIPPM